MTDNRLPSTFQRRWFRAVIAVVVLMTGFSCVCFVVARRSKLSAKDLLGNIRALARHDYELAETLASEVCSDAPESIEALSIAGEAATKAGKTESAARHFEALAERQTRLREPPLGLFYAGEACRAGGRLAEAEDFFQRFLAFVPSHTLTHERLAYLASLSGRREESVRHYFFLIKSGKAEVDELVLFGDLSRPIEQREFLEFCEGKSSGDKLVGIGLACHAIWEGKTEEGISRLERILTKSPECISVQAMLGELLVDQPEERFLEWHRRLPSLAARDPDIQYVRGLWASKHNQPRVAARCFWEAIRRMPTDRRATMLLGQQLRLLDYPNFKCVENRAKQLNQLTQQLDQVLRTNSRQSFEEVALSLEKMGRLWEAAAWGVAAQRQFPEVPWAGELFSRVADQLTETLPVVVDAENLALRFDLSSFPEFESILARNTESATHVAPSRQSQIRFEETTGGPDFLYVNAADPATRGARMFEQTGGGVAVLDYDGDSWPDLFFPQGGVWQTGHTQSERPPSITDRLFRNMAGHASIDVTVLAGLVDRGFGQGAAVGDFDNDGFPDLYVANIGLNQLLRNNGDGTFTDISDQAGFTERDWTASCVIVDLNDDGQPDLFDVNYVTGSRVFERICRGKACSPKVFDGAPDRLLLSRGDGTFETTTPNPNESNGKGLGIVVFHLPERDRLSLLIANDQVPNFLLVNRAAEDRFHICLDDEAMVRGVAFNQDGLAMASMGIAAEDLDGDGRIDFYISTFKDESSILLFQNSPGLFMDRAISARLRSATLPFVGWGAQCLDADLDGLPDIIAVNGHVDDYRDEGGEFRMRSQFFRNLGNGQFEEQTASQVGSLFGKERLGRGLSRLDWNRDGLMDFAVSNIGDRACLATNTTQNAGHFVSVRLVARQGARDAIGSLIEVHTADHVWRKQLVAGDGYMASNERVIQFGVANATTVTELAVLWPSGSRTKLRNIPVDVTLELCELSPHGILRRGPDDSDIIDVATERKE